MRADIVCAQNHFVFIVTDLIQVEEKTDIPVTIGFPDYAFYAFNESIHNIVFMNGMFP